MLQTERLNIREFAISDAPFIYKLLNSPGWLANIGDRNVRSIEDAEQYIQEKYLPLYDTTGVGAYVIQLRGSGTVIGTCGLYKRPDLDYPDIGFALLPQFEKNGYAFEASTALMKFAKETLELNIVYGITIQENTASRKLLERLGLKQIDIIRLKDDNADLLLFSNE